MRSDIVFMGYASPVFSGCSEPTGKSGGRTMEICITYDNLGVQASCQHTCYDGCLYSVIPDSSRRLTSWARAGRILRIVSNASLFSKQSKKRLKSMMLPVLDIQVYLGIFPEFRDPSIFCS